MSTSEPAKRSESRRSIMIVAVLCGAFLWWWGTREIIPEEAGPQGLVERALAELTAAEQVRPLLMEFDLLELSMAWLRAGQPEEAERVIGKVDEPILQARGLRAIAQGYLGNEAGTMGPALKTVGQITDERLRTMARENLLLEIARMGFADVAWEQATTPLLQARVLRTMSETDGQSQAAQRLAAVETALLAAPTAEGLTELAWTHLWLHHQTEVLALAPRLPPVTQDEIYAELFRMTRLENPDQAQSVLEAIPARLQLMCRLEAAKLNGKLETPAQFVASLQASLPTAGASAELASAWLFYTNAQWQLLQPDPEAWKASAAKVETLCQDLPAAQKIVTTLALSQIYYDALDLGNGHRCLEMTRAAAFAAATPQERLTLAAPVLEAAFRFGEADYLPLLLRDLQPDLQAAAGAFQDVTTLRPLLLAFFREGSWTVVTEALNQVPPALRGPLLHALADLPVEATAGQGYAISQDASLARYRQLATNQGESEAAKLAMRLKPGQERARAWLEIAKGLILKQVLDTEAARPMPPTPATE